MKNGKGKTRKTNTAVKKSSVGKSAKKTAKTEKSYDKKVDTIDVNIRNIKLTKECRKRLRKEKNELWGDVAWAIEGGNWFIPMKNHNYTHMKDRIESGMKKFFNLENPVEVEDFDTDIIYYDNH